MDGKVSQLKQESAKLNIPLSVITSKVIPGYLGSPKGVLQVATKQGFVALDGKLANGGEGTMHRMSNEDTVTGIISVERTTSIVIIFKRCSSFKNE